MLFGEHLVVVRGGGDLASGAIFCLHRAGFPVIVLELAEPLAIRRTVSFSSAVTERSVTVEGIPARRVGSAEEAQRVAADGVVAVLVSPDLPSFGPAPTVVVDARVAKRNLGTSRDDADLVIALGPGFTAGSDCHAVIETARGHRLGRVIWEGPAEPNTGVPGDLGGVTGQRVVRAPVDGVVTWDVEIGDLVESGRRLGAVADQPVLAAIGGVVRGLILPGRTVAAGLKIADVDPRGDRSACFEISDKARLVGSGVLEAVLVRLGEHTG